MKARKTKTFGSALEGISHTKIKKIKKAAEIFLLKQNIAYTECRFDVVTIDGEGSEKIIKIIPDAF